MKKWFLRILKTLSVFLLLVLVGDILTIWLTYGERGPVPPNGDGAVAGDTLQLTTLNLAHGRSTGPNQLLQSKTRILANLAEVETFLRQSPRPEIVCLQEADGPSFWSGGFNHLDHLESELGYADAIQADNVKGPGISYGTAILSDVVVLEGREHTFPRTFPTFSKGFALATVKTADQPVDVVSVHLDFASPKRRAKQLQEMVSVLAPRTNALILAGDFNCDWDDEDGMLPDFCEQLDVKAYQTDSEGLLTFPILGKRIDWILIDEAFSFESHTVHTNALSDHLAVSATIRIGSSAP